MSEDSKPKQRLEVRLEGKRGREKPWIEWKYYMGQIMKAKKKVWKKRR